MKLNILLHVVLLVLTILVNCCREGNIILHTIIQFISLYYPSNVIVLKIRCNLKSNPIVNHKDANNCNDCSIPYSNMKCTIIKIDCTMYSELLPTASTRQYLLRWTLVGPSGLGLCGRSAWGGAVTTSCWSCD